VRTARRRWAWFAVGFLVVFVGMAVTIDMYPMVPSGQAVTRCKLWEYYGIEIRRAAGPHHAMGPTSGSGTAALVTAAQHLGMSVVGGVIGLGIGWLVRKIRGSRAT